MDEEKNAKRNAALDMVIDGFERQGWLPAHESASGGCRCTYLTSDGLKCAASMLLTDDEREALVSHGATTWWPEHYSDVIRAVMDAVSERTGLSHTEISSLQDAHDYATCAPWDSVRVRVEEVVARLRARGG